VFCLPSKPAGLLTLLAAWALVGTSGQARADYVVATYTPIGVHTSADSLLFSGTDSCPDANGMGGSNVSETPPAEALPQQLPTDRPALPGAFGLHAHQSQSGAGSPPPGSGGQGPSGQTLGLLESCVIPPDEVVARLDVETEPGYPLPLALRLFRPPRFAA